MLTELTRSVTAVIALTLVLGLGYPLLVTGIAQLGWPDQAQGSLVERDGVVVGSSRVGQSFASDEYFHPRPSAGEYDAAASGGSNLGPNSKALSESIAERAAALETADGVAPDEAPIDLLTASSSGLDPHVSVEAARVQVARVAGARGLDEGVVEQLVDDHTEESTIGFLGADRVNVLELNLALDELE
jgi:K+-transporting ATPase ATPase C chain